MTQEVCTNFKNPVKNKCVVQNDLLRFERLYLIYKGATHAAKNVSPGSVYSDINVAVLTKQKHTKNGYAIVGVNDEGHHIILKNSV